MSTLIYFYRSKAVRVKSEYKNDYVSVNLDTEFRALKPVLNASAVVAYNGMKTSNVKLFYIELP